MYRNVTGARDERADDGAAQAGPQPFLATIADHDMGEIILARIGKYVARGVAARDRHRLPSQLLRQAQAFRDPVPIGLAQMAWRLHGDCRPGRAQTFRQAPPVAHQARPRDAGGDADQNAVAGRPGTADGMRLHMVEQLRIHALRRAPQRKLTQRSEVAGREIMAQCALGGLGHIHLALAQTLQQIVGREVDHLDGVGAVDDGVRHGFAHADAGDARDDVVEAFDVLNVQRGPDIDASRQQFLDIQVALGVATTWRIGVCQLVHQRQSGPARQQRIQIHLLQHAALVVDAAHRHRVESLDQGHGFGSAMRLDNADDHIGALASARLGSG
jgi:hypothetical protein